MARTIDDALDGRAHPSEAGFTDRRVQDVDIGGPCVDGFWYADVDADRFDYPAHDPARGVTHRWLSWRKGDAVAKPAARGARNGSVPAFPSRSQPWCLTCA